MPGIFITLRDYWIKPMDRTQKSRSGYLAHQQPSKKLAVSALLSAVAAALQAAGAFGGFGFAISALVTLPIAVAALLSVYSGLMSYFVTLFLLVILQPSELIIFPFTTGLLGLSIGVAYRFLNRRISIIGFNALCLTLGISLLLYVFRFPVLGPAVLGSFNFVTLIIIYIVAFFYSWFWAEVSLFVLKVLKPALIR